MAALAGGVAAIYTFSLAGLVPASSFGAESPKRQAAAPLRSDGCPPPSLVDLGSRSPQARSAALHGRFTVLASRKAVLIPRVNWRRDDYRSKQWQRALQRLWWLRPLLAEYVTEGDLRALRQARDLVVDWVRADSRGEVPRHAWIDKIAAERAPYVAYVARAAACERVLGHRRALQLRRSIRRHGRFLADKVKYRPTNHGLFVDLGLARLASQAAFAKEARRWREIAIRRFWRTHRGRTGVSDGVWREHSASYQLTATQLAEKFADAAGMSRVPRYVERMKETVGWLTMPDHHLAQIGDTNFKRVPQWAEARARDEHGLRVMRRSGYAAVKEAGSHLVVGASFFNGSHKHSDELSFQLYEDGHRIISDGGKYHVERDRTRRFGLSSRAHSVLTVDGKTFSRNPQRAYGSGILAAGESGGWYAVLARNPLVRRQGVGHTRLFVYRPSEMLAVMDRVRASGRHRHRRYFQLGPEIGTRAQGRSLLSLTAAGFQGTLHDARTDDDRAVRRTARGMRRPQRGWTFPGFRRRSPRSTVRYESRGRNANYLATFDLAGARSKGTILRGRGTRLQFRTDTGATRRVSVVRHGRRLEIIPAGIAG